MPLHAVQPTNKIALNTVFVFEESFRKVHYECKDFKNAINLILFIFQSIGGNESLHS